MNSCLSLSQSLPSLLRTPVKAAMTAVIGFATKEGVIVASDSQVTIGTLKQTHATKVFVVKFKNGVTALVARAGIIDGADLFQEMFEMKASETDVTGPRTIADTVEAAIKEVRSRILDLVRHPVLTTDYYNEHLKSLANDVLVGYVFEGKPYLYTADSIAANARKAQTHFATLGTGQSVATYILDGLDTRTLSERGGIGLAAYTVAMCKRSADGCGGPTQIGYASTGDDASLFPPYAIRRMERVIEAARSSVQSALIEQIESKFDTIIAQARLDVIGEFIETKEAELRRRGIDVSNLPLRPRRKPRK